MNARRGGRIVAVVAGIAVVAGMAGLVVAGVVGRGIEAGGRQPTSGYLRGMYALLNNQPDQYAQTTDQLRQILGLLHLPQSARLSDEQVIEGTFDRSAWIRRTYSYEAGSFDDLVAVFTSEGDMVSDTSAMPAADGLQGAQGGALKVVPRGRSGDGITVLWDGRRLQVELRSGQVQ